jgi:hypothetical protein
VLPSRVPKLVPFCPIWGNDASKSIKEEKVICMVFQNMWSFGI